MASFDSTAFDRDAFDPAAFNIDGGSPYVLGIFPAIFWRVTMQPDTQAFSTHISDHFGGSTRIVDYLASRVHIPGLS
jgi:hypothetical protein